jgi:hypothetical protein
MEDIFVRTGFRINTFTMMPETKRAFSRPWGFVAFVAESLRDLECVRRVASIMNHRRPSQTLGDYSNKMLASGLCLSSERL